MCLIENASEPQSQGSELLLKTGKCRRKEPGWDNALCCVHTGSLLGGLGTQENTGT